MPRPARFLGAGLALLVLVSCTSGSGSGKHPQPTADGSRSAYIATTAWSGAHMKVLGGLTGSFRSQVVGTPCTEPRTKPCVVGGAQISEVGAFTLSRDAASYEHRAFGLAADVSEARGYRVRFLPTYDAFISAMGLTSRAGCWAPVFNTPLFGSRWSMMPAGFAVMSDADAQKDPAPTGKAQRFGGVADVELVLKYLGLGQLYDDMYYHYHWGATRVPIELRVGAEGLPTGFAVDGKQLARALVGPDPSSNPNAPAAFRSDEVDDKSFDAEVRNALEPMRGEFVLSHLGEKRTISAPPKRLQLPHDAKGNDPCPARS